MKKIIFEVTAFNDFTSWGKINKKNYNRILLLIKDILRNPFIGIGKPEPLKHKLKGYWSRRIDDENRLVYKVNDNELIIISCKYHYK